MYILIRLQCLLYHIPFQDRNLDHAGLFYGHFNIESTASKKMTSFSHRLACKRLNFNGGVGIYLEYHMCVSDRSINDILAIYRLR